LQTSGVKGGRRRTAPERGETSFWSTTPTSCTLLQKKKQYSPGKTRLILFSPWEKKKKRPARYFWGGKRSSAREVARRSWAWSRKKAPQSTSEHRRTLSPSLKIPRGVKKGDICKKNKESGLPITHALFSEPLRARHVPRGKDDWNVKRK